ncbi:hypothetical protein AHiyo1_21910 [Arthrobacter sp. Hiyo1]|nr:hypothetical protein AHiyo1_21910 [Arthrobacter sp. Hiyo1]
MVCSAALSPRSKAWTVPKRSTSATVTKGSLSAWHFAKAALTAWLDAPTVMRFWGTTFSAEGLTSTAAVAVLAAAGVTAFATAVAPPVRSKAPTAAAAKILLDFFMVVLREVGNGYSSMLPAGLPHHIRRSSCPASSLPVPVSAKRRRDRRPERA